MAFPPRKNRWSPTPQLLGRESLSPSHGLHPRQKELLLRRRGTLVAPTLVTGLGWRWIISASFGYFTIFLHFGTTIVTLSIYIYIHIYIYTYIYIHMFGKNESRRSTLEKEKTNPWTFARNIHLGGFPMSPDFIWFPSPFLPDLPPEAQLQHWGASLADYLGGFHKWGYPKMDGL